MTSENDIVLIHFEGTPTTFARVESISPDVKKNWFIIDLLLLQIPLQNISWILKDIYIDGEEFTMEGKKIRLEKINNNLEKTDNTIKNDALLDNNGGKAEIISFSKRKKK